MTQSLEISTANNADRPPQVSWRALAQSSSPRARSLIPYRIAQELTVLPISLSTSSLPDSIEGGQLHLAICKGRSQLELSSQLKLITNIQVKFFEIEKSVLEKAISTAYHLETESLLTKVAVNSENLKDSKDGNPHFLDLNELTEREAPNLLTQILNFSYAKQASDIHLASQKDLSASVSIRCSGEYKTIETLKILTDQYQALIRYIKILCKLDITDHVNPQEGMFECRFHDLNVRLRVSIIPSLYGHKIALRVLHHYLLDETANNPEHMLRNLGLSVTQEEIFIAKIKQKGGLVLISGPTGSGKSTLLYSLIETVAPKNWNIISLEDPVEREMSRITQVEVKSSSSDSYLKAFKSLLRQDPDMILVSEIRDAHVLETAIQAALSGTLVLSTIHAARTLELILRLFELGCTPVTLGSVLKLTSSQRLIPRNCNECLQKTEGFQKLKQILQIPLESSLWESKGCEKCNKQKSAGVLAVYETCCPSLPLISQIFFSFKEGMDTEHLNEIAKAFEKAHFIPFQSSVRNLLLNREISPATALLFFN